MWDLQSGKLLRTIIDAHPLGSAVLHVMVGGFRLENTMKDCYSKHPLPERFPLHIHTDTLDFPTSSSLRKQTSFCVATNGFPAK